MKILRSPLADGPRIHPEYIFLIEKILREPWLGLVIKPSSIDAEKAPGSGGRSEKAEQTYRCIVLTGPALQSLSAGPAMASDIAIHGHLFAATTGTIGIMSAHAVVDREGWPASMLHRRGRGNITHRLRIYGGVIYWQASAERKARYTGRPD